MGFWSGEHHSPAVWPWDSSSHFPSEPQLFISPRKWGSCYALTSQDQWDPVAKSVYKLTQELGDTPRVAVMGNQTQIEFLLTPVATLPTTADWTNRDPQPAQPIR